MSQTENRLATIMAVVAEIRQFGKTLKPHANKDMKVGGASHGKRLYQKTKAPKKTSVDLPAKRKVAPVQ